MDADIYSAPDLSGKVRYNRNKHEDRTMQEVMEVDIYESASCVLDYHTDFQSHEGGQRSEKSPALQKGCIGLGGALCLGLLCTGMLAAVTILSMYYVSVALENNLLQTEYKQLENNHSQLQVKYQHMNNSNSQLQSNLSGLAVKSAQLQHEVKQLKEKIEGKWCPKGWSRFGCSCYNKFTEKKTWSDSRIFCQERGADLVIINSKEEQTFVRELNMNGNSWVGLKADWSTQREKYEWKWVDGSPPTTTFWAAAWSKRQHYLYNAVCCDNEGKWTQSYNFDNKNWICEK